MRKQALSPEAKTAITMGLISAGTTAAAAVGTTQIQSGIQSAYDAVSRSIAFKKMMNDNPQLNKIEGKKARRYFNTLYNTAPELAKDPFAAGSWVKKVDEYDYVDPQSLKTLADTGQKLRQRSAEQTLPAFMLAQSATQAGMDQYSRLQAESRQELRDLQAEAREEARARQAKKLDIALGMGKSLVGAGGKYMAERAKAQSLAQGRMEDARQRLQERYEDQAFRLGQEARQQKIDEWKATQSPAALGLSPQEWRKRVSRAEEARKFYGPFTPVQEKRRERIFQQEPVGYPGSASNPFMAGQGLSGTVLTAQPPPPPQPAAPKKSWRERLGF